MNTRALTSSPYWKWNHNYEDSVSPVEMSNCACLLTFVFWGRTFCCSGLTAKSVAWERKCISSWKYVCVHRLQSKQCLPHLKRCLLADIFSRKWYSLFLFIFYYFFFSKEWTQLFPCKRCRMLGHLWLTHFRPSFYAW